MMLDPEDWPGEDDRDWIVFSRVPALLPGSWRVCLVCRRTREVAHALVQGEEVTVYGPEDEVRLPTAGQFDAIVRADLIR